MGAISKLVREVKKKLRNKAPIVQSESTLLTQSLTIDYVGLAWVFVTPALGGFLYGVDLGATSFVLSMLLNPGKNYDDVWWISFSKVQQGLFVSALSLGAFLGSHLVLMYFSHTIGRRMEIRICSILYIFGTILNVLSGTTFATASTNHVGFFLLFLGRICFGMGVGFIMHGAPAYMAEMCPPQVRGAVVSAKETVIVGGILVGYFAGNLMSSDHRHWSDLYGVSILVAIPMLLLTFQIPRSKRWLLLHGHKEEAKQSMQFVYKGDIEQEFEIMATQILHETSTSNESSSGGPVTVSSLLCSPSPQHRAALIASMGLIMFQQFSGQPSILSYATILFQAAGWSGNESVITAVLMMCVSVSTVLLVDQVGRKRFLRTCCIVMSTALLALSTTFWRWDDNVTATNNADDQVSNAPFEFGSIQKGIILVSMFVYIGGYQIGFGPITWCVVSEIFPLKIRGKAIALGVELNYLLNFLVQFGFPIVQDSLGWGRTFGIFAIVLLAGFVFVENFVPETKGLTLEEIQVQLLSKNQHNDVLDNFVKEASSERSSLLKG